VTGLPVQGLLDFRAQPHIITASMAKKPRSASRRPRRVLPNCRAILLCEKVIKDAISGTISLIGIFTRLGVTQFPGRTTPFYLFAQLAHGMVGEYELTMEVQDDREATVIGRSQPLPLRFSYRREVIDVIIPLPPVVLEHPGSYSVAVFADGNEVGFASFDTPSGQ
jgi:hypothetical protein